MPPSPHFYFIPGTGLPSSHVSQRGLPESTKVKDSGCVPPVTPHGSVSLRCLSPFFSPGFLVTVSAANITKEQRGFSPHKSASNAFLIIRRSDRTSLKSNLSNHQERKEAQRKPPKKGRNRTSVKTAPDPVLMLSKACFLFQRLESLAFADSEGWTKSDKESPHLGNRWTKSQPTNHISQANGWFLNTIPSEPLKKNHKIYKTKFICIIIKVYCPCVFSDFFFLTNLC